MSKILKNLLYAKSHEWVKIEEDGTAFIGITDYAQDSLGDITYIEMPLDGTVFKMGDVFGVVESVKAASDLYMPFSGEVIEVNPNIDLSPQLVNDAPYEEGWMVHAKVSDPEELKKLLSSEDYSKLL